MKALEIVLLWLDKLLTAIFQSKAQDKRDEVETNPFDFFINHFGGMSSKDDKADKADTRD